MDNSATATTLTFLSFVLVLFTSIQAAVFFESINAGPASPFQSRGRAACQTSARILTSSQLNWMTKLHNNYRKKPYAANMKIVTWGYEIAKRAQALANTCTFKHAMLEDCTGKRMGQNLYAVWGTTVYPKLNLTKPVEKWFNENKNYNIKTLGCNGVCGHYTQVVWAATTRIGCGYKQCDSLQMPDGSTKRKAIMVACNYLEAGNVVGASPYVRGKKCSKCGSGFKCKDNLCVSK